MKIEDVLARHPESNAEDWRELRGSWIHATAIIGEGAIICEGTVIGAGVVIGNRTRIGIKVAIYKGATIGSGVLIRDGAVIGNYAWVGKWTEIGVGAKVSHKTTIREGTSIGAGAWIGDGAKIGPYATICEGAKVNADTDYAASPLYIVGTRHPVCEVAPGVLAVGCEEHSIADWLAWAESIGRRNGYTPAQIAEYTAYFELAAKLQALITPALT